MAPARRPSKVALAAAAERRVDAIDSGGDDAVGLARVALELAGPDAIDRLALRLQERGPRGEGAPWAWALGVAALPEGPGTPARPRAVLALRAALSGPRRVPDWRARVAAASSLGILEAQTAAADVSALLLDPEMPREAEGPLLFAVAGCGGPIARAHVESLLERGGDIAWSGAVIAITARFGASIWPELARAAAEAAGINARGTAAAALLLLAEPASACSLVERYGHEPDPAVRRVLLQALAAGSSPAATEFLAHVAEAEGDRDLALVARVLADALADGPRRLARGQLPSTAEVREALFALDRGRGGSEALGRAERGATLLDLPWIERTLRRLPLREDAGWRDDHARLAQLRAQLLCSADSDCSPTGGTVARDVNPAF